MPSPTLITSLVRLLLGMALLSGPALLRAAETAAPKAEATPVTPPAAESKAATTDAPGKDTPILELPKIAVTAHRVKELDKEIKRLTKAITREKNNLKATELDKALNNEKLAKAAVLFGGNSSAYLAEVAATRVSYMETERDLLSDMREPRTLDEMKILQDELDKIRIMQRDLDKASH